MRLVVVCAAVLLLAACDSVEERAQKYYESGLALIESGEPEKALLELKNVFDLDASHREARTLYARTARDLGRTREAYGQYLRLVEQYPDDVEGRISLAQMAFESRNWSEFDRHATVAVEAQPDDFRVRVIKVGLDYRTAVTEEDEAARDAVVRRARDLSQQDAQNTLLQAVLIDGYSSSGDYEKALSEIDRALAAEPDKRAYHDLRLTLLAQVGDTAGIEQQLLRMTRVFPDDQVTQDMLVRYYVGEDEVDKAEAFLREQADPTAEDLDPYFRFISFVLQASGPDAASAELEAGLEASPGSVRMNSALASIEFAQGRQAEAIARLETLLETAEADDQTRDVQVALAKMLLRNDNEVGARRLVENVLAADAGHGGALKMQAVWLTRADDVDAAVTALRRALDSDPADVEAMTLMAAAYSRAGSHELARDFLSLAAEASGNRPAEAISYARSLQNDGRIQPAEDALLAALRAAPNNVSVLIELGRLYLGMEESGRVRQVIDTLRRIDSDTATSAAVGMEAALVGATQSVDQVLSYLEGIEEKNDENIAAKIVLIQAYLAAGQREQAQTVAREALAEKPRSPQFRFLGAVMDAINGDLAGAEQDLRALTQDEPNVPQIWLELSRILAARSMPQEATQAIEDGIAANPDDLNLKWALATRLEQAGDIEGAIAIYEDLYASASEAVVVANNLASLLSSYRSDAASLERAFTIARRLRDTREPAFQDTYGWILHQRGDHDAALGYLEPAAASMTDNALVQYHLAKTYLALDRPDDALETFRRAVSAAGDIDTRPQIEEARREIARLQQQ